MVFLDLIASTRILMLNEMTGDLAAGKLYISDRLSPSGKRRYPELLKEAILKGNPASLAQAIRRERCLNLVEQRGYHIVSIPCNASDVLAEGEYNRYYIRALCIRAMREGKIVEIYRAKRVVKPRFESEIKIGCSIDPVKLLADLRGRPGVETALSIPGGPGSGISVKLVDVNAAKIISEKVA